MKVKEISKLLFQQRGHPEKKLECKLKKQEIVFDTAVFTYELTFDNTDYTEFVKAKEARYLINYLFTPFIECFFF